MALLIVSLWLERVQVCKRGRMKMLLAAWRNVFLKQGGGNGFAIVCDLGSNRIKYIAVDDFRNNLDFVSQLK